MGKIRQINIKNRTYYFYNDQIDLKDFDARLLKIDKKDYNEIDIYYIGYVTIKKIGDYNNINSVNPLFLIIDEMISHFNCFLRSKIFRVRWSFFQLPVPL